MWMPVREILGEERFSRMCEHVPKNDYKPLILTIVAFATFLITCILLCRKTPVVNSRLVNGVGFILVVASIAVKVGALRWMFDSPWAYRIF